MTFSQYPEDAWDVLKCRLSAARQERLENVVQKRTAFVRLILQDVNSPHNVAACLRSAEAFGLHYVDIIKLQKRLKNSNAARGVQHWLELQKHEELTTCVSELKQQGYAILAAMPNANACPIAEVSLEKPIAVLFGNEHEGVASCWKEHVDQYFTIPMAGMVESLNISVSCAISLWHFCERAKKQHQQKFYMDAKTQKSILNTWICKRISTWEREYTHYVRSNR